MHGDSRNSIVVCGAGAAGMAAALTAARTGAVVDLIEAGPEIGGTVAHCLIHTLGGLYDASGELINGGLAGELATRLHSADATVRKRRMGRTWVLAVDPRTYLDIVRRWIEAETRIRVHCAERVIRTAVEENEIVGIETAGRERRGLLRPIGVIDATGTADVVRLIDRQSMRATNGTDAPGLVWDDDARSAGGLIFTLRRVAPGTLAFPKGVGVVRALRSAASEGLLPPECGKAWLDTGLSEDEVYVKLFVPFLQPGGNGAACAEVTRQALQTRSAVIAFLRQLPGFGESVPDRTGLLGVRDGGRIRGEYCLTVDDVRSGRRFEDAACRGCWPIEYWDPQRGVSLEELPGDGFYDIPLRSLKVRGLRNVWAAGKCLSADRYAQASARVAGTCWSMGEAAGRAAARHDTNETVPR